MNWIQLFAIGLFVFSHHLIFGAEDTNSFSLDFVATEAKKQDVFFLNIEARFVLESRLLVKPPESMKETYDQVDEAPVEIHLVTQGPWRYVKVTYFHNDSPSSSVLVAYDGEQCRALRNSTHFTYSDRWQSPLVYAVPPHRFAWAPWGFTYKSIGDLLAAPQNNGGKDQKTTLTLQRTSINGTECYLVERQRHYGAQQLTHVDRFFLAPKYNYLVIKAESFGKKKDKIVRYAESETDDWREVAPGIWLPHVSVYRTFCDPATFGHNGTHGELRCRLLSVNLNPDYPKSFFSNIPLPKDGVIETYRGGRLVSRRVVGNPRDPEERQPGLPPWVWILGNVVLVALLLGVYLRYRTGKMTAGEPPEDDSREEDTLRKSD